MPKDRGCCSLRSTYHSPGGSRATRGMPRPTAVRTRAGSASILWTRRSSESRTAALALRS
eukprot:scaffold8416_cov267-Pinguiococcus_pyrenoidosus.AAC.6